MTAATAHLFPGAVRLARARGNLRLEHLAVALGICLPVPLFAATGLSLPLPATVERIAAALVPWAEAATLDTSPEAVAKRGSIIERPGERGRGPAQAIDTRTRESRPQGGGERPATARSGGSPHSPTRPATRPVDQTAPTKETRPGQTREEPGTGGSSGSSEPAAPAPPQEQPNPGPGQEPPPPPAPPPPPPVASDPTAPVRDVVDATKPIVDGVTQPVKGVTEPVEGAVPIPLK